MYSLHGASAQSPHIIYTKSASTKTLGKNYFHRKKEQWLIYLLSNAQEIGTKLIKKKGTGFNTAQRGTMLAVAVEVSL